MASFLEKKNGITYWYWLERGGRLKDNQYSVKSYKARTVKSKWILKWCLFECSCFTQPLISETQDQMITAQQRCLVKHIVYFFSYLSVYKVGFCPDLHKRSISELICCPQSDQTIPQMMNFSISWKNTHSQELDWKPIRIIGSLSFDRLALNQTLYSCEISIRNLALHQSVLCYTVHLYFIDIIFY